MVFLPSDFLDPKSVVRIHGNRLPHWQQDFKLTFITIHFGDALPLVVVEKIKVAKKQWLNVHPQPWSEQEKLIYKENFEDFLEKYLDRGYGCSIMKDQEVAVELECCLIHDNEKKYELISYVIMPNHAHVLVKLYDVEMSEFVGEWKKYSALRMNRMVGRQGPLWQAGYWDTMIRNQGHLDAVLEYIDKNYRQGGVIYYKREDLG